MSIPKHIVVVVGNQTGLEIDLTAFRTVRAQTGIPFSRLKNPTFNEFTAYLRRMRMQRGGPGDVHLALPMNPKGAQFSDKLVSAELLSEVLTGVNNLFLAGCSSAAIGDMLGVVPAVVTLLEGFDDDASARNLAELFWLGICQGYESQQAFDLALERLPEIAEYAYLHIHNSFLATKAVI